MAQAVYTEDSTALCLVRKCLCVEEETEFHSLLVDYFRINAHNPHALYGLTLILQRQLSDAKRACQSFFFFLPKAKRRLRDRDRLQTMLDRADQMERISSAVMGTSSN